jgi:CubicO group peptidase (beta-lactamase class C family)
VKPRRLALKNLLSRVRLPNRARVHNPAKVTVISPREVSATATGLEAEAVAKIWRSVLRYYKTGLQPAIALCVRHRGQIILDRTVGHARGNGPDDGPSTPKILADPDTRFSLASGSKPVTAMVVHLLQERGLLHVDDQASKYVSELRGTDKSRITLRQLLNHRAGVPMVPPEKVDLDILTNREAVLQAIVEAPIRHAPGATTAYHALSAGFILAEVIERKTGRALRDWVRDAIMAPMGLGLDFGVPEDSDEELAREYFTGPRPIPGLARQLEASLGVNLERAVELSNDPRYLRAVIPSGNITGTPADTTAFMDCLRLGGEFNGVRVFEPETVSRAIKDQGHRSFDRVILLPLRYSMGFMLGGERLSFFGRRSPRAFGHLGFTNNLVWTDPDRELSVALLTTGKPFLTPELGAWLAIPYEIARRIPHSR